MEAKIWNRNDWINETDPDVLNNIFDTMIKDAGFNVIGVIDHYFDPCGYTKLYLLAESHFAIHTFPEHGKTYIELSSCNHDMQVKFEKLLNDYIHGGDPDGKEAERDK